MCTTQRAGEKAGTRQEYPASRNGLCAATATATAAASSASSAAPGSSSTGSSPPAPPSTGSGSTAGASSPSGRPARQPGTASAIGSALTGGGGTTTVACPNACYTQVSVTYKSKESIAVFVGSALEAVIMVRACRHRDPPLRLPSVPLSHPAL